MKKKIIVILLAVTILVAIGAVVVHSLSDPTSPPDFPLSLTMTKIDANGTEINDLNITIESVKTEYKNDKLYIHIEIYDFDGQKCIEASKDTDGGIGEVRTLENGYNYIMCWEYPDVDLIRLCFDSEYDRWALSKGDGEAYYVGSVSGKYTVEELRAFFELY